MIKQAYSQANLVYEQLEEKINDILAKEIEVYESTCPMLNGGKCRTLQCLRFLTMDIPKRPTTCERFYNDYVWLATEYGAIDSLVGSK